MIMKKLFAILLCAVMLGALCVPASAAADIETGLVVHYTFDVDGTDAKGVASFADIDASRFVDGKIGKALSFTGNGSGVTATVADTISNDNGITISLWVSLSGNDNNGGNSNLIGWNNTAAHMFIQNGSNLGCHMSNEAGAAGVYPYAWNNYNTEVANQLLDSDENRNAWAHLVLVSPADGIVKYYINGVEYTGSRGKDTAADEQDAGYFNFLPDITGDITLGCWGYGNVAATGLQGALDDVRIYNRALTAEDAAALYAYTGATTGGDDSTGDDNADTFDALTVVALVALTSTAGVVVSKKRR